MQDLAMFPIDGEDLDTDVEHLPFAPADSYVGSLPRHHESLEDAVRDEDVALADAIERLEWTCIAFASVDRSASAAQVSLRKRVGSLTILSNALANVCGFVLSPGHRELFAPGGLLEPYLSAVHMWTGDMTQTLQHLADELNDLRPNWAAFRECVTNAEWISARANAEQSRLDRVADALPEDLRAAVDELFVAFAVFRHAVSEPFG